MSGLVERAPAKINLTLHVLGRRADGYHDLDSLVAFARVGDELRLDPDAPAGLTLGGPFARALRAADAASGNLVMTATRAFLARWPGARTGAFHLVKRLPLASGIGGGSADAAAALRLLARRNSMRSDDAALVDVAAAIGSDVPVCLASLARRMTGRGEGLGPPVALTPVPALLVNPGVATPTGPVFSALGLKPGDSSPGADHPPTVAPLSRADLASLLDATRNDLEAPAMAVRPEIADALSILRALPSCRGARMSGSGATVFGLFDTCRSAGAALKTLRAARPGWWFSATMIG